MFLIVMVSIWVIGMMSFELEGVVVACHAPNYPLGEVVVGVGWGVWFILL